MVKVVRRWLERRAFASLLVGEFMQSWYGHTSRIVLYGGTEVTAMGSVDEKRPHHLCYVGRLANDTGIRSCLRTFIELHQHDPSLRLTVVGDGPLRAELEYEAKNNWVGWQAHPETLYQRSNVSFTSGYLGILEALACQTTVVTYADSELKSDYLQSTPFHDQIIIAKDSKEAAQLITIQLLKPSGNQPFDQQRYSWQRVADLYEQAWQSGKQLAVTQ
jgi:glycosyltransferase involved in cell wall biosynthesis